MLFFHRTLPQVFAAFLIGVVVYLYPMAFVDELYFADDIRSYFAPGLLAIGRTLVESGSIPPITLQTWTGGNLAGEYQYAFYNPVNLLLYSALPQFTQPEHAIAFLVIAYAGILSSGVFWLARVLGIGVGFSFVAAFVMASNNLMFSLYANSWIGMFASFGFMVWAVAMMLLASRSRWHILWAIFAVYLVATAGAPHGLILTAVATATWCVIELTQKKLSAAIATAAIFIIGVLLSAPAIAALIGMSEISARVVAVRNIGVLLPRFLDLANVSNPTHFGLLATFNGEMRKLSEPIYYVAWFFPGLMAAINWRAVTFRHPLVLFALVQLILMIFATQGPDQLGPLRWTIRFVPVFQLYLLLFTLLILTRAGTVPLTGVRWRWVVGAIGVSFIFAMQSEPRAAVFHGITLLILLALHAQLRRALADGMPKAIALIFAGSVIIWALSRGVSGPAHMLSIGNTYFKDPYVAVNLHEVPSSWEVTSSEQNRDIYAQMGLMYGRSIVNSYSPIGFDSLKTRLCVDTHGRTCEKVFANLFERNRETGARYVDLMRIGAVSLPPDERLDALMSQPQDNWQEVSSIENLTHYRRDLPNGALPGTVSWVSPGIAINADTAPSSTSESLNVTFDEPSADPRIVFARLAWPGYSATLNGKPLITERLDGFLLSARLPSNASSGEFQLTYTVPNIALAYLLSALAALAGAVMIVLRVGIK